jgi:MFS family permease
MILFWFSMYAYVPQLASYAEELGASYKLIGIIGGAYGLSQTVLRIPIGILSDKLMNRKTFILFGILCAFISSIIVYFIPNPYTLVLARFLAGVASATWVNFTVLFISYFRQNESAKAVGIVNSNCKIGQLIGMFIGGFIAISIGVRNLFFFCAIVALVSLLMGFFVKEEQVETVNESNKPGILTVVENKHVLQISFLGCITQFITYSTTFGFTPIVATNLGADSLQLSYLSTLNILPQILFSILSGTVFTTKFGEKKTLLLGFILSVIICVITPFTPNIYTLYIIQILSGIGSAITFSILMAMVVKGVESHLMSTTMGFFQATYGVGMIIGPMILGAIADSYGLTVGFSAVGVIGLLSIWFVVKLKETQ